LLLAGIILLILQQISVIELYKILR
jgi:hypothetical protein